MSFEGYFQHICEKGHVFDGCGFEGSPPADDTCECGAKSVWSNVVDDTNCESSGCIRDWSSLQLTPPAPGVLATYRIPTQEEKEALQCYLREGRWILCGSDAPITKRPKKPRRGRGWKV